MLESLFGNEKIEKILFDLYINNKSYGYDLSKRFSQPVSAYQKAFQRLEKGGVIVSFLIGKTRVFEFNPRYPFLAELKQLIDVSFKYLPQKTQEKYTQGAKRKRPRRTGKPL